MSNIIDFENVSLAGLESSPVSKSLAGLRANESGILRINTIIILLLTLQPKAKIYLTTLIIFF